MLALAEDIIRSSPVSVILGANVFQLRVVPFVHLPEAAPRLRVVERTAAIRTKLPGIDEALEQHHSEWSRRRCV